MLKVGMIGGGYFGQFHINAWERIKHTQLCGVVVMMTERRTQLQSIYPDTTFFSTIDTLIKAHPY